MVSLIASSMLFGQLILNQPIVVDSEQYSPTQADGTLIACTWFPLCTIPELFVPPSEQTQDKTTDDKQSEKLA